MLSSSSKYALKAVLYLAIHTSPDRKMQVREISENIEVPKAYTGKLLQQLSKRRLISSSRGPKGGFYLDENNRQNTVMALVEAIDGKTKLESCILGLQDCDLDKPCPLHNLIASSRSRIISVLEDITVDELAKSLKDKKSFLPL